MKSCEEVINSLKDILKKCWNEKTSSDPKNWSKENPAWGQCAVTALILDDYLTDLEDLYSKEIVRTEVILPDQEKVSHYYNIINQPGQKGMAIMEKEIDLTREQFPEMTRIPRGKEKRGEYETTRDYILSYPDTMQRYELLKSKVDNKWRIKKFKRIF